MKPHTFTPIGVSRHCTHTHRSTIPILTPLSAIMFATTAIVSAFLSAPAHSEITEAQLQSALREYCIPPAGHNCNSQQLADHTSITINLNGASKTSCLCRTPGRAWVASSRTCEVPVCSLGQYVDMEANCGAGHCINGSSGCK